MTYNPIRESKFKIEIFTDASLTGWGSYSQGEVASGLWSKEEQKLHVNALELLAAFMGLKCFAKNYHDCEILLRMDNTTSIAYVNRMGGIKYPWLTSLSRKIWQWCEKRDIWVFASYLTSKQNKDADEQ